MARAKLDAKGICPECGRDYALHLESEQHDFDTGKTKEPPLHECTSDDCPAVVEGEGKVWSD